MPETAVAGEPVEARPGRMASAGLATLLVLCPLAVTRFTADAFQDAKLVLLLVGVTLLWIALPSFDRRVLVAAGAVVAAFAIAAFAGVDVARGLTITEYRNADGGLLVIGSAAVLAAIGASAPASWRAQARRFLVLGGTLVAAIAIVYRVLPDIWNWVVPERALRGATLGHPVFGVAFVTAALAAVLHDGRPLTRGRLALVAVLTLTIATFDERSSLILPPLAVVVWIVAARPVRRVWLPVAATVVLVLAVYEVALVPILPSLGSSAVEQVSADGLPAARFTAWGAIARGAFERPLTGWGPGMALTAYFRGASPADLASAGRGWSDAHDLFVEAFGTAGILGALSMFLLVGVLVTRWRRRPDHAWAMAAAAALLLFVLFEPVNVVITPLTLFIAGIAAARSGPVATARGRGSTLVRRGGVVVLVAATLVTVTIGAAATAEWWGTRFENRRALQLAIDLQPWRSTAYLRLGRQLATAETHGAVPVSEVRAVIAENLSRHPWDPILRWWAAGLEDDMGNPDEAAAWLEEQRLRFPSDANFVDAALADVRRP